MSEADEPRDEDGQLHGLLVKRYPWGSLDSEIAYVHGQQHGVAREYHANGRLKQEWLYVTGRKHGPSRRFDDQGCLIEDATYRSDELDGRRTVYRAKDGGGSLVAETIELHAGRKHGEHRCYNDAGVLIELTTYVNDELSGPKQIYWEDGRPNEFQTWRDGVRSGLQLDFYTDGRLRHAAFYEAGQPHGPSLAYHGSGKVTHLEMYWLGAASDDLSAARPWLVQHAAALAVEDVEALLETFTTGEFYDNGQKKAEYKKVNGVREGPYRVFRPDGALAEDGSYRAGKVHGEVRTFFSGGKVRFSSEFADGQKHGLEREYNEGGQLLRENRWERGLQVAEATYFLNGFLSLQLTREASGDIDATWFEDTGERLRTGHYRRDPLRRGRSFGLSTELDLAVGLHREYWPSGALASEQAFENGKAHGPARYYHITDGRLTLEEFYSEGTLTRRVAYDENGTVADDTSFFADGSRRQATQD